MIPWLTRDAPFPPPAQALTDPNGLLAASEDISSERVLDAYRHGIFPWYSAGQPVLWWSPDPRMVLIPHEFKRSDSLRKTLRQVSRDSRWEIRIDHAFIEVMQACADSRKDQDGTWITPEIIAAYHGLQRRGFAHSVETWFEGRLCGGLYGVNIGHMFYGESMFARIPDASKIALAHLAGFLHRAECRMIDCQQNTPHLASLGAHEIPRSEFLATLSELTAEPQIVWPTQLNTIDLLNLA